jgi:hypothetical protein
VVCKTSLGLRKDRTAGVAAVGRDVSYLWRLVAIVLAQQPPVVLAGLVALGSGLFLEGMAFKAIGETAIMSAHPPPPAHPTHPSGPPRLPASDPLAQIARAPRYGCKLGAEVEWVEGVFPYTLTSHPQHIGIALVYTSVHPAPGAARAGQWAEARACRCWRCSGCSAGRSWWPGTAFTASRPSWRAGPRRCQTVVEGWTTPPPVPSPFLAGRSPLPSSQQSATAEAAVWWGGTGGARQHQGQGQGHLRLPKA